jgi:large subunit ribosomal protein L17
LRHEHLTTTVPRAKELRPFVERLITIAKRGLSSGAANGRVLHARRLVMEDLQDREVVSKLFETLAPRFVDRPGGYTRLLRLGFRKGDAAEIAQVELLGSEYNPRAAAESAAKAEGEEPKAKKGVGSRLRAAAQRLRGKGAGSEGEAGGEPKAGKGASKPGKQAKQAMKRTKKKAS